eukprot:753680-Hanusia_phi.AAC.8
MGAGGTKRSNLEGSQSQDGLMDALVLRHWSLSRVRACASPHSQSATSYPLAVVACKHNVPQHIEVCRTCRAAPRSVI